MTAAIGTTECIEIGCRRERASSANSRPDGPIHYPRCWEHTALRQSNAFGHQLDPERAYPSVDVRGPADRLPATTAVSTSR